MELVQKKKKEGIGGGYSINLISQIVGNYNGKNNLQSHKFKNGNLLKIIERYKP